MREWQRPPATVIEDELYALWPHVPLTAEVFSTLAPTVTKRLSPGDTPDADEALSAFLGLLMDRQGISREDAAVAAVYGIDMPESFSIDRRLSEAANEFGTDSSRTGRRWARRGVESLARWIEQRWTTVTVPTIELEVFADADDMAAIYVDWTVDDEESESNLEVTLYATGSGTDGRVDFPDEPLRIALNDQGEARVVVAWVAHHRPFISLGVSLHERLRLDMFEAKTHIELLVQPEDPSEA